MLVHGTGRRRSAVDERGWRADGRVTAHDGARPGRHLAGPDPGDAVHLGHAVAAVAGQAQRAAVAGVPAGPQDGQGHGVARRDRDGHTVHR